MRGPDLRRLVRSLRTKSYEKLQIRKHLAAITPRAASAESDISSKKESDPGPKPHGQIDGDQVSIRDSWRKS